MAKIYFNPAGPGKGGSYDKSKRNKKAVGDYNRANKGGVYSPRYGYIMLDRESGNVWTDEFYSLGRNDWKQYHSPHIVNLSGYMAERGISVNMANVREAAEELLIK